MSASRRLRWRTLTPDPPVNAVRRLSFFSIMFFSLQIGFLLIFSVSTRHKGSDPTLVPAASPEVEGIEDPQDARVLEVNFFVFVGQGLMMSYLRKYSFSAVGFSFLCACIAQQWGVVVSQVYQRVHCSNLRRTEAEGCPYTYNPNLNRFENVERANACTCPSWSDPVDLTFQAGRTHFPQQHTPFHHHPASMHSAH